MRKRAVLARERRPSRAPLIEEVQRRVPPQRPPLLDVHHVRTGDQGGEVAIRGGPPAEVVHVLHREGSRLPAVRGRREPLVVPIRSSAVDAVRDEANLVPDTRRGDLQDGRSLRLPRRVHTVVLVDVPDADDLGVEELRVTTRVEPPSRRHAR